MLIKGQWSLQLPVHELDRQVSDIHVHLSFFVSLEEYSVSTLINLSLIFTVTYIDDLNKDQSQTKLFKSVFQQGENNMVTIFFQQHFEMHLLEWKCLHFIQNVISEGPFDNEMALVQVMAECRDGDQPLSEPLTHWPLGYFNESLDM